MAAQNRRPLFSKENRADDHPQYRACRDGVTCPPVRRSLERIWANYGDYLPEHAEQFLSEFRRAFPQRAWELYVLGYLAHVGKLEKPPTEGPDLCVRLKTGARCWVEAISPMPGSGRDAVRGRLPSTTAQALGSSTPVLLRYTNAIEGKLQKLASYRAKLIVARHEPAVIALSQGGIEDSDLHDHEVPLVVRALYGVGETHLAVPIGGGDPEIFTPPMPTVTKANDAEVSSRIFLEARSAPASAVLFARRSVFNLLPGLRRRRLLLAHNANACAPLARGALPVEGEVWQRGAQLEHAGGLSAFGPLRSRSKR